MTSYLRLVPGIAMLRLGVRGQGSGWQYLYQIENETSSLQGYGLEMAAKTGLPHALLEAAETAALQLADQFKHSQNPALTRRMAKRKLIMQVDERKL